MNIKLIKMNYVLMIAMILADIFVKILIDNFLMGKKFFIISDKLGFVPFLNTEQMSVYNNELGLGLELSCLIVVNVISVLVVIGIRKSLKQGNEWNALLDIGTVMILAGTFCSLIDKIFWKGSLDYLLIVDSIIDMKDIYMVIGLFVCVADVCRQLITKYYSK